MGYWFSRRKIRTIKPEIIIDALEERIVLDATIDVQPTDQPDSAAEEGRPSGEAASSAGGDASGQGAVPASAEQTDPVAKVYGQDLNVVLISNALDHLDQLAAAAENNAKVIVYDGDADSLSKVIGQLQEVVQNTGQTIAHLAWITHGDPGVLKVTEGLVYSDYTVTSNPEQWQILGSLMAEGGRIDLYGCDIGKGADGIKLVSALADVTGKVVWASDDTTGTGLNADWDLEVRSSSSSLSALLDTEFLAQSNIVLDNSGMTNAGFETNSTTGWTTTNTVAVVSSNPGTYGGIDAGASLFDAYSTYMLRLDSYDTGGGDLAAPSRIQQTFTYQYNDDLVFVYCVVTSDGGPTYSNYDDWGYRVTVGGTVVAELIGHSGDVNPNNFQTTVSSGWKTATIDLPSYASVGDTVVFELWAGNTNDNQYDTWMFVDLRQAPSVSATIPNVTVNENAANTNITMDAYFYDRETTDANLTYAVVGNTAPFLFDNIYFTGNVLTLDYAPNAIGTGTITVQCQDADGNPIHGMVNSSFTVTVNPTYYDLPSAEPMTLTVARDGSITFMVIGYDSHIQDPNLVSFDKVSNYGPYHGTIAKTDASGVPTSPQYDAANGYYYQVFTYTPAAGYWGSDNFQFTFSTQGGTWKTFGTTAGVQIGTDTNTTYDLKLVDLGGDGDIDLVAANSNGATNPDQPNLYYLNNGSGGFLNGTSMEALTGRAAEDSYVIAVGDINNDGYMDAVVRNGNSDTDAVYLWNEASGGFSPVGQLAGSTGNGRGALALADFNGDGYLDAVVGGYSTEAVRIYWNNADGTGTFSSSYTTLPATTGTTSVLTTGDFNRDGYVDIFVGKYGAGEQHAIYYNDGYGVFTSGNVRYLGATGAGLAQSASVGDVNGDGDLDIVVGRNGVNFLYTNTGVVSGYASWSASQITTNSRDTRGIALADVDRDGDLDVLTADYNNRVRLYTYDGGTAFTGSNISSANVNALSISAGDVDGDGDIDVVVGISGGGNLYFENPGFNTGTSLRHADPALVTIQVEAINNWSFEKSGGSYQGWTLDETYETPTPDAAVLPELNTFGIITNQAGGTEIRGFDATFTIHDYWDGNEQVQFSLQTITSIPGMPGITIDGSDTAHTAVLLSGGLRDASIYQTITIPQETYLDKLTLSWDISYWNSNPLQTPGNTFGTNQFIAVYLYDASTGVPVAVWTTTNGVDADVVGSMAHQEVTLTLSSSLVQAVNAGPVDLILELRVCGLEWYLDAAIDDFKLVPHRHYPAFQVNPADTVASLDTTFVSMSTASAPVSVSSTAAPILFTSPYSSSSYPSGPRSFSTGDTTTIDSVTPVTGETLTEAPSDAADSGTAQDVMGGTSLSIATTSTSPADTVSTPAVVGFTSGAPSQTTFDAGYATLQASTSLADLFSSSSDWSTYASVSGADTTLSGEETQEPESLLDELTPTVLDESAGDVSAASQEDSGAVDQSSPQDAAQSGTELVPPPTILDQLVADVSLDLSHAAHPASGDGPADAEASVVFNMAEINAWSVINAPLEWGAARIHASPAVEAAAELAAGRSCAFNMDALCLADIPA